MKNLKINRWAIAIIIGMAGGLSFELPYLKVNFQPEMQASLAFIMATYPSFPVLVAIQMVWAVTTILFMWSATIKAVSLLGNADEQGGLMGIAEGARGFSCLIAGIITLGIFKKLGADTNPDAFKGVIIGYGVLMILFAIVCWFVVPDGKVSASDSFDATSSAKAGEPAESGGSFDAAGKSAPAEESAESVSKSDVIYVIKQKTTWYSALFVFGIYLSYSCLTYTTSYLVDCFGMTMVMATFISILRSQVFRTFSAPCGSLITMKSPIKSPTRVLQISAIANTIAFAMLLIFPSNKSYLYFMVTIVMISSFCIFLSRGMYFATIGELHTPKRIVGTTVGVISLIGFLPDAFIYMVIGHWQDTLPAAEAYRNLWLTGAFGTALGIVMSTLLLKELKKIKARAEEAA